MIRVKIHNKSLRPLAIATMAVVCQWSAGALAQTGASMGEILVLGSGDGMAPGEQSVTVETLRAHQRETVGEALDMVPGVHLSKIGARNEQMVYVRGHDLRQVPVFLDGVPVYVPYDGYVDLGRFTNYDLERIDVAKGFSSLMYGPNAMGGAINLITRRPDPGISGEVGGGSWFDRGGSNGGNRLYSNIGVASELFYLQAGASWLDNDGFRLPGDFVAKSSEDGGVRNNSWNTDKKYNVRVGWMPNETDAYALAFVRQEGSKGNPPYAGDVPGSSVRYWHWPYWDKDSVYALTRTALGAHQLTTRIYYDTYGNGLYSYDDASYTSQTRPYAFRSYYDDYTRGFNTGLTLSLSERHQLRTSFHWKDDVHRERDAGEPWRKIRDITSSLAVESVYAWTDTLTLVAGVSADRRRALEAERLADDGTLYDLPRDNADSTNAQAAAHYELDENSRLSLSFSQRSRFATIKDRYSFRFGTSIPNPSLRTEKALHSELAYRWQSSGLHGQVSLFHSDTKDMIQSVSIAPDACGSPPCSQMQNIEKVSSQGVELDGGVVAGRLELGANYTFLDRENRSNAAILLTDSPRHTGFLWSRWTMNTGLQLLGSVRASSSRVNTTDGRQQVGGFAVLDLSASYRFSNGLSIRAGVDNIADRLYSYAEGFPEAGREYSASFNWSF